MIDTNSIPQITDAAAQQAQSVISSWNVVCMLIAGIAVHAYHTVVRGGGVKRIASNFWNGEPTPPKS